MKNQVQLITYVDRLGGGDLRALQALLTQGEGNPLRGRFGGVHLLPFFHPIDGADAGFDPIDHTRVDPRLGDWSDLAALAAPESGLDVMADVIVNHMSSQSPQFLDYQARGEASEHAGLFLTLDAVFPDGANEALLTAVYRPRPGLPLTMLPAGDARRLFWTTFTPQQIDIDVEHASGEAYLDAILRRFASVGIRSIRLDAAGYAIKRAGRSCFMMPETFDFIAAFSAKARALGIEVLVEVHSYYRRQIEIARQVDWVYDFALPPLVLHAFAFGTAGPLKQWAAMRPRNALTVLDTHDGIGIIDIGADAPTARDRRDWCRPRNWMRWSNGSTATAAARAGWPPARRPPTLTCTRSTAPSSTRWAATSATTCWRGRSSSSCPAFRRCTTSACWRGATTWRCCSAPASGATSTAITTPARRSTNACARTWSSSCCD